MREVAEGLRAVARVGGVDPAVVVGVLAECALDVWLHCEQPRGVPRNEKWAGMQSGMGTTFFGGKGRLVKVEMYGAGMVHSATG